VLPLASLAGRRQRMCPDDQTLVAQALDAEWAVTVLGDGLQELDALGPARELDEQLTRDQPGVGVAETAV
jgi:hypothetical protein